VPGFLGVIPFQSLDVAIFVVLQLNGPVGTESRGVAGFANLDTVPLNLFKITFGYMAPAGGNLTSQ
jgi:hypothetical protein